MNATKQSRPTKDALQAGYTYPKGRLLPLALDRMKVSKFQNAKTSANKRFLYYVCKLFGLRLQRYDKKRTYANHTSIIFKDNRFSMSQNFCRNIEKHTELLHISKKNRNFAAEMEY